jgi:prolyl-tRNA synthetase
MVVELARRDTQTKETVAQEGLAGTIVQLLDTIQENIYQKALNFRTSHFTEVNSYDEFKEVLEGKAVLSLVIGMEQQKRKNV